ncbi:MAG TPA: sigma-54 dependent transcriptional regulator [Thermoanaerobaculia bacterium]|nr:sigma-54 dependent transcriptional regulator [Thermoanaerobaculia bacterium]
MPDRRLMTDTRKTTTAWAEGLAPALEVPALTVLGHPEAHRVGELATLSELVSGEAVALSRLAPLFGQPGASTTEPLAEVHLSRRPLLLEPGTGGQVLVRRAGSPTLLEIDGEPLAEERSLRQEDLERGVVLELGQRVVLLLHRHPATPPDLPAFGLVGASAALLRLRREIALAAGSSSPVLLRGESGTGKELVARALHAASPRSAQPYVTVNMAAVPPSLAASELFGAAKGAYTGAAQAKEGFFQRAHGGTLFLDEIGETPADVQPLLLRALESGEIQPVGSAETRRVSVRVIAATDADLEARLADGRFRAPLFHRLAGFEIRVPALRQRRSDLGRLLYAFLDEELGAGDLTWLQAGWVARLARFDWPGNVRQLRFVAQRLAAAHRAGALRESVSALLSSLTAPQGQPLAATPPAHRRPEYRKKEEVGEEELLAVLRAHHFELKPAAAALGISRTVLYELIEKSSLVRKAGELDPPEIAAALARCGGDLEAAALDLAVSPQGLKRRMKSLGMR